MAEPESRDLGGRDQDLDHRAEDGLEDGQREPGAGLAEGAGGEGEAGQQGDVGQGRVAVEHLDEEPVDNGRWGRRGNVSHHEWPAWRQAWWMKSQPSLAARSCLRVLRVVEIRRCIAGPPVPWWVRKILLCTGVPLFSRDEAAWGYRCLNAIRHMAKKKSPAGADQPRPSKALRAA